MTKNNKPELIVDKYGNKQWYLNGKIHREDGPAIEYPDGTKEWYFNGKLHREDGPALEYPNGSKLWYVNDKPHRIDGPAVEYSNGFKEFFLFGEKFEDEKVYKASASILKSIWIKHDKNQ